MEGAPVGRFVSRRGSFERSSLVWAEKLAALSDEAKRSEGGDQRLRDEDAHSPYGLSFFMLGAAGAVCVEAG